MQKVQRSAGILIALTLVFSIQAFAANLTSDDATSLSVGGLVLYDRDFKHNAAPFKVTNETTITVELIGLVGRVDNIYMAEDDRLTSNVQASFRPPLGDYDGGTTFTFTLTPENGAKTIWAVAQNQTEFSFPPTTGTITLDTNPPCFSMAFTKRGGDVRVAVMFSEDVHGFDAQDIVLGGAGGAIKRFGGNRSRYVFLIAPNDPKNIKVSLRAGDIWDVAGNPAQLVNMAPAVEELTFSAIKQTVYSTDSNLFEGDTEAGFEELTARYAWVDFFWTGLQRDGSMERPYNTLSEALANTTSSDTFIIKPGFSAERIQIARPFKYIHYSGAFRIGGAGVSVYGRQVHWVDADGNVVAWLDDNGRLFLTGTVHTVQGLLPEGQYVWAAEDSSGIHAAITTSGDLYLQAGFSGDPSTGDLFFVANPNDPDSALISVSNDGVMHLAGASTSYVGQNCTVRGPKEIPATVAAHGISPLFPTPNYWKDLPDRYRNYLEDQLSESSRDALSPLTILSMFVFYPNMRWQDDGDGFIWPFYTPYGHQISWLRAKTVNSSGGDWSRPTFGSNGDMYVIGADGYGYQRGFSLSNKYMDYPTFNEYHDGFNPTPAGGNINFHRIAGILPGRYTETRNFIGDATRAKTLAWYPRHNVIDNKTKEKMNVIRFNGTDENAERVGYSQFPLSQLWLDGDLYYAFWEEDRSELDEVISCPEQPENAGILRIKNIDSWKSSDQYEAGLITEVTTPTLALSTNHNFSGREWEDDQNHRLQIMNPAGGFVNLFSKEEGEGYISLAKKIKGAGFNYFMWRDRKFTIASFIQFGPGYNAYVEPDGGTSLTNNQRYVYAISPHNTLWGENALYLGRSLVTLKSGSSDTQWSAWEYYIGTGIDGEPLWNANLDLAKSILYGEAEMSHPSTIYDPNSQLYIMAAFTNNNGTHFTSGSHHYSIYVARRPWGPWRKVFTNDYNGLIYRAAQDLRYQGGSGYEVHLLAHPIDASDYNASTKSGKVRFWLTFGAAFAYNRDFALGRSGPLLSSIDWRCIDETFNGIHYNQEIAPWDEYFKQSYYNLCFQEIELDIDPNSPEPTAVPAVAQQSYPEYRMEGQYHYDHWGWRPEFDANGNVTSSNFNLGSKWFGYEFKVGPKDICVSQLGRFYVSGNTRPHPIHIVRKSDHTTVVTTTIYPAADGAKANMFTPPSETGAGASTRLGADGYLYSNIDDTTLTANTNYYLISREGIYGSSDSAHSLERTRSNPAPSAYSGSRIYAGYRFRTGPLGLRVTRLYRENLSSAARYVVIERAQKQIVNDRQDITLYHPIQNPFAVSEGVTKRVEEIDGTNSETIDGITYFSKDSSIDLEPLTDYYIGVQVEGGDLIHSATSATNPYDHMVQMWFNPNAFQFLHPAQMVSSVPVTPLVGQTGHGWKSISHSVLPAVADLTTTHCANPYNDGVGLSPAVEYPVFFDFIVPDRFHGYRNQLGTGILNDPSTHMVKKENATDHASMPTIKNLNPAGQFTLNKNIKVLGAVMSERRGRYCDGSDLNGKSDWNGESTVFHTFSAPNTTFGPLDPVFKESDNNCYNMIGNGIFNESAPPNINTTYFNCADYITSNSRLKVDVYENNRFTNPMPQPTPKPYNDPGSALTRGIYSGMQIKLFDHDVKLSKIGRYFPSGHSGPIDVHEVVLVRTRDNVLMAVGNFLNGDYTTGSSKFVYARLTKPGDTITTEVTLVRGESYILAVWDHKGPDTAENLTNRQFGLIEDYPSLETSSSIEILGPATANNSQGNPDYSTLSTTYLESAPSVIGRSQGYGPLNMIYHSSETQATPYTTDGTGGHGAYYTGYVGIQITIGAKPIMVTHLGRFKVVSPANQYTHQVVIMRKDLGVQDVSNKPTEIIASVIVDPTQPTDGHYNYTRLQNPVILQPNTTYYVASYENCQSSTNEHYLSSGPCSLTASTLWSSVTIDTAHGYAMNPTVGTWSSGGFTPIVNLKAQ